MTNRLSYNYTLRKFRMLSTVGIDFVVIQNIFRLDYHGNVGLLSDTLRLVHLQSSTSNT